MIQLGCSNTLILDINDNGYIFRLKHYATPGEEEVKKISERIDGIESFEIVDEKFDPVLKLVEEKLVAEKWMETLSEKSPFPLKEIYAKIVVMKEKRKFKKNH